MISRTDAWKCSDGTCFTSKKEAYDEEIKVLFNALPKAGKKPLALHLKRLVSEVEGWLRRARELTDEVKGTPKDKKLLIVKELLTLVSSVEVWVNESKSFLTQMKEEPDIEVRRSIAGQGG